MGDVARPARGAGLPDQPEEIVSLALPSDSLSRKSGRPIVGRRPFRSAAAGALLLSALLPLRVDAQTTGSVLGRVLSGASGSPLGGAEVRLVEGRRATVTDSAGRFVIAGVPSGTYSLEISLLSYRTTTVTGISVRADRRTRVTVRMETEALGVEPLVVEAERIPLVEPEVVETHQVTLGRELRSLPVETAEEAIELTTGVSDGHFRGGRVGQEVYLVDGLSVKNQFEGGSRGLGLEFAPTSLEEIDVTTGGLDARYGSNLSGAVSFVTRKGHPERWEGRASVLSDHWAPDALFRGYSELSLSAGGPVPFLGEGTTLFADVLAQGLLDADPRARGLTCLEPGEVVDGLRPVVIGLRSAPATAGLYCPFERETLPHQEGDRLIAFLRADRPLGTGLSLTATVLHNRLQRHLYTPEFKYNPRYQLGRRLEGTLATLLLDWSGNTGTNAFHFTARTALMRLERYLGVVDPEAFDDRARVAGFGASDFEFLGEDFVRRPISEQLASGRPVPGYLPPGGAGASPYGPAARGIFFTDGTPGIANWSRSDLLAVDLSGEVVTPAGSSFRAGTSTRLFRVESYERTESHLPGSFPIYARFYPATVAGFAQGRIRTGERLSVSFGARVEAFRSDLAFRPDRVDFLSPQLEADWKVEFMPRVGFAGSFSSAGGETSFRFSFSRVAQPPDFRFFLDTTLGDSLRADIRHQGNPNLAFEQGRMFEIGVGHLVGDRIGMTVTAFRKDLTSLVTGGLRFSGVDPGRFTTGDEGTVQGIELSGRARWRALELRLGYALQEATGLTSGAFDDRVDPGSRVEEFPLAFDRRHSIDVALYGGAAAGARETAWGGSAIAKIRSGFPLDRLENDPTRLPWTVVVDLRLVREVGSVPGCSGCRIRVIADGRNVLGRDNIRALRRDTGGLGPPAEVVLGVADELPAGGDPIPVESPAYAPAADLDGDGLITAEEQRTGRVAATLDRHDPSLFFGGATELRLGAEVTF